MKANLRPIFAVLGLLFAAGCEREIRSFETLPKAEETPGGVQQGELQPGQPGTTIKARATTGIHAEKEDIAFEVAQGKRLFRWYNCSGCHAGGGGGMGPPLMDSRWFYGNDSASVFATIMDGRPNGMPSFRGRIPEGQVWQLAAYVRSMSGQLRKDVAPGRSDTLAAGRPESRRDREVFRVQPPPQPQ